MLPYTISALALLDGAEPTITAPSSRTTNMHPVAASTPNSRCHQSRYGDRCRISTMTRITILLIKRNKKPAIAAVSLVNAVRNAKRPNDAVVVPIR